jgi:NADPH-dependent 2,4-dienoyl-CoA reductase/sulfur reductase-like enzyme
MKPGICPGFIFRGRPRDTAFRVVVGFDSLKRGYERMNNAAAIRRVAVLGAGVMGAQIAAHLANADVPVVLFDLPAKDGDPNGIVTKAIANLAKLNPAPLASRSAPS